MKMILKDQEFPENPPENPPEDPEKNPGRKSSAFLRKGADSFRSILRNPGKFRKILKNPEKSFCGILRDPHGSRHFHCRLADDEHNELITPLAISCTSRGRHMIGEQKGGGEGGGEGDGERRR